MKVQDEKEDAREERERLREERKAEQELAAERARLDKEREHYVNALQRARGDRRLGPPRPSSSQRLARIDDAIEQNDYRVANIRAGYVYVISNRGAFGHDIVKIGLTRRLEPMDRVRNWATLRCRSLRRACAVLRRRRRERRERTSTARSPNAGSITSTCARDSSSQRRAEVRSCPARASGQPPRVRGRARSHPIPPKQEVLARRALGALGMTAASDLDPIDAHVAPIILALGRAVLGAAALEKILLLDIAQRYISDAGFTAELGAELATLESRPAGALLATLRGLGLTHEVAQEVATVIAQRNIAVHHLMEDADVIAAFGGADVSQVVARLDQLASDCQRLINVIAPPAFDALQAAFGTTTEELVAKLQAVELEEIDDPRLQAQLRAVRAARLDMPRGD